MPVIQLPHGWLPRPYQEKLWQYLEHGGKRAIVIAHRRWGKDDLCLHFTCTAAHKRVGGYWHMLPEASQARKAIWNAVNAHTGRRRIDEAFPRSLRRRTLDNEMMIEFNNGSTWQVVGSDNFNSLVGSSVAGVVFSEWALAKPAAWAFIRPILRENGGHALFITTPRGRNHAFTMFEGAQEDPQWYTERSSAEHTGAFSDADLAQEKAEYIREYGAGIGTNLFEQEYLCSFEAAIMGAYWGKEMREAEEAGRITAVPVIPGLPVHTAWDLGFKDSTAIWCFQVVGNQLRVVDFLEDSSEPPERYTRWLDERGYHGIDWLPHDARYRTLVAGGRNLIDNLIELKRRPRVGPEAKLLDGINAGRKTIKLAWFDKERCALGLEALRQYRANWDEKNRAFRATPLHNWASHPADSWRYLSLAWTASQAEIETDESGLPVLAPERPPAPAAPIAKPLINTITVDQWWDSRPASNRTRF